MRPSFTPILLRGITLLVLVCGVGCRANPDSESSFSVPSFGRVPDQWEPEITEVADPVDEDLDLGF